MKYPWEATSPSLPMGLIIKAIPLRPSQVRSSTDMLWVRVADDLPFKTIDSPQIYGDKTGQVCSQQEEKKKQYVNMEMYQKRTGYAITR